MTTFIEAARQALEVLEQVKPLLYDKLHAIAALRQAIEQAEKTVPSDYPNSHQQEPVGEVLNERGEVDYISYVPPAGTLLYTTPQPRREWVGLTDADKDTTLFAMGGSSVDYIRGYESGMEAAEDKLKEKNSQ